MSMIVSRIFRYPIKSCAGEEITSRVAVDVQGLAYDRYWAIVRKVGKRYVPVTQRTHPRMARIRTLMIEGPRPTLRLLTPMAALPRDISIHQRIGVNFEVDVWGATCSVVEVSRDASEDLSFFLETECRLVRLADDFTRDRSGSGYPKGTHTRFADGAPLLFATSASLGALNDRLGVSSAIMFDRFRANVWISGARPWREDAWSRFKIGSVTFESVKPCPRCAVPDVNQVTGERNPNRPVWKALLTCRWREGTKGDLDFGINCAFVSAASGTIDVGDSVHVIDEIPAMDRHRYGAKPSASTV
jgi:uncharacterized protein